MAKNANKGRKNVNEIMAEAQAITITGPLDHHSQSASWTPPAAEEPVDEALLEQAVVELEAAEVQAEALTEADEAPAIVTVSEEQAPADESVTFDSIVRSLDPAAVDEMVMDLAAELDDRSAFEERVDPDATSIHKSLKKARAAFVANKDTARVLLAVNQTAGFINRSISEGARYNVYAFGKLADLVQCLSEGQLSNAINVACMKSLFALRNAGVPFTSSVAKAAASDKIHNIDPAVKRHLIRHTVSASTAPTQASSTMQALETLGIVTRTGSRRDSTFTLTDHPAVKKLEEKLGFATAA